MAVAAERELSDFLAEECRKGSFPSWQALVLERGKVRFEDGAGLAVVEPVSVAAGRETLYDLASLTKPLVTAFLALRLAEEGVLPLDLPVGRVLADLALPPLDRITVLDLLSHRAGFPAWAALYLEGPLRPSGRTVPLHRFVRVIAKLDLVHEPGTRVLYSDLGYIVLGALLEAVTGVGFAELAKKHLLSPLGLEGTAFPPRPEQRELTAATERGNAYERRLAAGAADDPRFRSEVIWGEVHDGNAMALGGAAPHAGLFATARATAALAGEYLSGARLLGAGARAMARADLTPGEAVGRTAAFELSRGEDGAAGQALAPEAFGHSGFTGTSVWMEPQRERIYVLLTNRVHPEVPEAMMNPIRRRFHLLAASV